VITMVKRLASRRNPVRFALLAVALAACAQPIAATSTPAPTATARPVIRAVRPGEKWIEVDLDAQMVRLWIGEEMQAEYAAASGVQDLTIPGEYRVQQLIEGPIENVPGVWVSDIVIYDLFGGMGIHSRPMDEAGKLLDETLGVPASGGCVRVGESAEVFSFASLSMRVWVH